MRGSSCCRQIAFGVLLNDPICAAGLRFACFRPGAPSSLDEASFHTSYELGFEPLGEGAFSTVKRGVKRDDGAVVAVKCVQRKALNPREVANLEREVTILQEIYHPYVVKLLDVFDEGAETIFLVTQFAAGGDLVDAIVDAGGSLTEVRARSICFQLLSAVEHLHCIGITHRDIKPENVVLLSETRVLLADFGLARHTADLRDGGVGETNICGTPEYMAPETIMNSSYMPRKFTYRKSAAGVCVGAGVDVWACGVVAFIVLGGYSPFGSGEGDGWAALFERIVVRAC